MVTERYKGEANANMIALYNLREKLKADGMRVGALAAMKIERRLHRRQRQLQKAGIRPHVKVVEG